MTREEALEWLRGERSMVNSIYPSGTEAEVAKADAYMVMQAYYVAKAWSEGLFNPLTPEFLEPYGGRVDDDWVL